MNEEIKEIKTEPTIVQMTEPIDEPMVTIPLKRFAKLVKKVERLKAEVKEQRTEKYRYYNELLEAKETIKQYKDDMSRVLGIKELEKVKEV